MLTKTPAITLENLPTLVTPQELAQLLRVAEDSLAKLVSAGVIPAPVVNFKRTRRWNKTAIVAALSSKQGGQ